jgi:hypothetical protein
LQALNITSVEKYLFDSAVFLEESNVGSHDGFDSGDVFAGDGAPLSPDEVDENDEKENPAKNEADDGAQHRQFFWS